MTLVMPASAPMFAHLFRVECTVKGWRVSQDGLLRGLFVTFSSAMDDVRARGVVLRRLRETWSIEVIGREKATVSGPTDVRSPRPGSW